MADRHDPAAWTRTLAYRGRAALPFDPALIAAGTTLLLDMTVYIDSFQGSLAPGTAALLAIHPVLHAAPALAELSLALGLLDPKDARTPAALQPVRDALGRISPFQTLTPAASLWVEAAVLAGILARTRGIPRTDRRKLLNDALLFLLTEDAGTVLLTRNVRDFDLLLQIKPDVAVLFYDRT